MGAKRGLGLKFQKKASRPPLSREEFLYWRDLLSKVLKLGTEFEINLPSADRGLKSKAAEPCIHSRKKCVDDCANLEMCLSERHPTFCQTRGSGSFLGKDFQCPAENDGDVASCTTCPSWMLNCRELDCALHAPFCTICPSFLRKSDAAIDALIERLPQSQPQVAGAILRAMGQTKSPRTFEHIVKHLEQKDGKCRQAAVDGEERRVGELHSDAGHDRQ